MHPAAALVRALARTSGEAALRRGLPVYLGLLAFAGLLFGGNGLEARTVVAGAETSPLARGLLWAGWQVLLAPTLAAIWQTPTSLWLRSLPAPRGWHLTIALAMSLVAQSLWTALWAAGGGPIAGLAACGGALLGHATLLARPQGIVGLASIAASFAALVLAPRWLLAFGTWPIALVLLRSAWLAAPTRAVLGRERTIRGPAALALARAQLVGLVRGHGASLLRGALFAGLAAAAAWLAAHNNAEQGAALRVYACGFLAPAALGAGSALAGPMLVAERRAAWLLTVAGAPPRTARGAFSLAAACVGAGLGALAGVAVGAAHDMSPRTCLDVLAATAPAGAALATIAALTTRWSERFGARASGRLVLALFAAIVAALASLAWLGAPAVAAWTAAALAIWLSGHVQSAGPTRATGGDVLFEMIGVRKRLGTRVVLDAASMRCDAGELLLVLGENGAGKSTLLRIAAGIVEPDAGEVRVGGAALAGGGVAARAALGYAPDTSDAFPELSVAEVVSLVAAIRRAPPPPTALRRRLGLDVVWGQRMRTLSFGQVKRTYLLAAMVGGPPLWLLDEPSNGLDPDGVRLTADLLREHVAAGGGAVVATNDAGFVAMLGGSRVRLADGRLARAAS